MAPGGNFVIVWESKQLGKNESATIRGQVFDSAGLPIGDRFYSGDADTNFRSPASVAMDVNGNFVVARNEERYPYPVSVFAWKHFADGSPNGAEFRVNTSLEYSQSYPTVAMAPSGNFVVSWNIVEYDGSESDVLAQRFDADANRLGAEFYANSYTTSKQVWPSVAMDSDGDFVIVWASFYQDGSESGIFGQRFAADGTASGGEFQANTYTSSFQNRAEVAMDSVGNFVVVWASGFQDGSYAGIFAQRFDAGGQRIGEEFNMNTFTVSAQDHPAVAVDADGDFVVAWQSNLLDGDFEGIAARLNPPALRAEPPVAGGADHPAGIAGVGVSHTFATDPNPVFAFSTTDPGVSGSQVLSFRVTEGDLEVYSAQWSYPEGFVFNGFTAAAPPDAAIGLYKINLYNAGLPDFESPIRALTFQTAYVDVENDTDAAGDPVLVSLGGVGVNLVAYVPTGGDADLGSITVPAGGSISIELDAGVLTNPQQDSNQSLHLLLTSVDPDTGDYNDGQGDSPLTFSTQNPLSIGPFFADGFESGDTSAWSSTQ